MILRFTLAREKNNLRIALKSVSERYVNDSIEKEFKDDLDKFEDILTQVIIEINKKRRKYHYNFLSMNEIFNLPPLEVSDNTFQKTFLGEQVNKNLFYFPFVIYLIIFVNDFATVSNGFTNFSTKVLSSEAVGYFCLCGISYLCRYCSFQKRLVCNLFTDFYLNDYKYNKVEENFKKKKIMFKLLYPFYILFGCITFLWRLITKTS